MRKHNKLQRICAWVLAFVSFGTAPAFAEKWLKAESQHFIFYSNVPENTVRSYMTRMEAFDQAADLLFGEIGDSEIPDDQKRVFYYLNKLSDFKVVVPKVQDGSFITQQACYSYGTQSYSVAQNLDGKPDVNLKNPADLTYLYRSRVEDKIRKYFSYRLPVWVSVGLSEFFMGLKVDKDRVYVGIQSDDLEMMQYSAADRKDVPIPASNLIAFDAIIGGNPPKNAKLETLRLQEWLMVNYFLTNPIRREKFNDYLQRYQKGEDSLSAFKAATGMQPEEFKAVFKDYAVKGAPYLTYPYVIEADSRTNIQSLPDYGEPLPLIYSTLSLSPCIDVKYGQTLWGKARNIAASFPKDSLALLTLAKGELQFGDPNMAISRLLEGPATEADNLDAQHTLGKAYLAAADKATENKAQLMANARTALTKAYKLAPSSSPVLYDFARASKNLPGYPDDNTLAAAEMASFYALSTRRYFEYDAQLADLYILKDRYSDAIPVLESWLNATLTPELDATLVKLINALKANTAKAAVLKDFEDYLAARYAYCYL